MRKLSIIKDSEKIKMLTKKQAQRIKGGGDDDKDKGNDNDNGNGSGVFAFNAVTS